jgi:hypothetical protein
MGRLFTSGAESADVGVFTTTSGVTASTVQKRNGNYSFLFAAGASASKAFPAAYTELYFRKGIYPTSHGSTQGALLALYAAGTASIARLIRSNGVDSQGSDVGLSTTAKTIQENIETDPGEVPGTAWTIAALNAAEFGVVAR